MTGYHTRTDGGQLDLFAAVERDRRREFDPEHQAIGPYLNEPEMVDILRQIRAGEAVDITGIASLQDLRHVQACADAAQVHVRFELRRNGARARLRRAFAFDLARDEPRLDTDATTIHWQLIDSALSDIYRAAAAADEWIEAQALHCPWYVPLEGRLGADWGVIVNPESSRFGLLTFEHDDCGCPDPDDGPRHAWDGVAEDA